MTTDSSSTHPHVSPPHWRWNSFLLLHVHSNSSNLHWNLCLDIMPASQSYYGNDIQKWLAPWYQISVIDFLSPRHKFQGSQSKSCNEIVSHARKVCGFTSTHNTTISNLATQKSLYPHTSKANWTYYILITASHKFFCIRPASKWLWKLTWNVLTGITLSNRRRFLCSITRYCCVAMKSVTTEESKKMLQKQVWLECWALQLTVALPQVHPLTKWRS